uniref:PID domain-containing protein n=1 Tax=Hippocampus comes TaxID=109280 RepID=A0A3Q2Z0K0_HIPCM
MRTGATGIFPAFYAVRLTKNSNKEQFLVRFLGSVQVPIHKGSDVLCAAMPVTKHFTEHLKYAENMVLTFCGFIFLFSLSLFQGDQCFHFFHLKNISFCGCHPKHNKYFGFISKHPDQPRFACHVMMADTTLHPLAKSVGKAFHQYYKEHIGYSCPTEDIFIE